MSALGAAKGRSFYKSQGGRQGNVSSTGEELICCSGLMAGRNFSPHEATSGAKGNFGQFIATAHSGWWDLCVLFTRRHLIDAVPLHSFLRSKDKNSSLFFFITPLSADPVNGGIFVQGLQSGHWITLSPVQMGVLSLF